MNTVLLSVRRNLTLALDRIGKRLRNDFYIYLGAVLSIVAIADTFTVHYIVGMRNKSFDAMVKYRFKVAPPSKDIVIVDIDEKSLAAMAGEFGRWPWPRQVFGEFVEQVERQKPAAIVFDILFSDPDVYNAESDAYFNEAIAHTGNTWFPMVRLPVGSDTASALRAGRVPGARATALADTQATIGAIIPFFESIQRSGRLGFNNIIPDIDGVCRDYPVVHREHGFEIPSLSWAVAHGLDTAKKAPPAVLLNWRGKPFTYTYVSFSDLYADMRKEHPERRPDEFAGRIIIIGSTAPSLGDIKVTAVDRQFPGVEILATAVDNLRKGDWLRLPQIPLVYLLVALLILWATAIAFYRKGAGGKLDQLYGLSQFFLIAVAYTAINLFNVYINLTGPVMFGFIFYSIARYYSFATARALDGSVVQLPAGAGDVHGFLLALHFDLPTREEKLIMKLAEVLARECREPPSPEWLSGRQKGFWRLFENTLFLCWKAEAGSVDRIQRIRTDADALCGSLKRILNDKPLSGALPYDRLSISRAEGGIGAGKDDDWRMLLGAAIINRPGKDHS
jgi:adenylate cyclase